MKLEVLMSCMNQTDANLVFKSKIVGDVLVINQCDREDYNEFKTQNGLGRLFYTRDRGLTKSRNMAIGNSKSDICLLCDDDEVFENGYVDKIINAYTNLPQADVIIFKMSNRTPSFSDKIQRLKFPKTMKVSSWQISFKRKNLIDNNIKFDELLGAGTRNGAEEELKFLMDCQKAKLKIYYVPEIIATVGQTESTWFKGFDNQFFENRGATTRYILGLPLSVMYAVYYIIRKRNMYKSQISSFDALKSILKGIKDNKISKMSKIN